MKNLFVFLSFFISVSWSQDSNYAVDEPPSAFESEIVDPTSAFEAESRSFWNNGKDEFDTSIRKMLAEVEQGEDPGLYGRPNSYPFVPGPNHPLYGSRQTYIQQNPWTKTAPQYYPKQGPAYPSYGRPQTSYGRPQTLYGRPQPSYGRPQPSYGRPQPSYGRPQPSYGRPRQSYGRPQPSYGRPLQSYGRPRPSYGRPRPSYGRPQPSYLRPQLSYDSPQDYYRDYYNFKNAEKIPADSEEDDNEDDDEDIIKPSQRSSKKKFFDFVNEMFENLSENRGHHAVDAFDSDPNLHNGPPHSSFSARSSSVYDDKESSENEFASEFVDNLWETRNALEHESRTYSDSFEPDQKSSFLYNNFIANPYGSGERTVAFDDVDGPEQKLAPGQPPLGNRELNKKYGSYEDPLNYHSFKQVEGNPFKSSYSVDTEPQPKSSYWADPNKQNYHSFKQAEKRNPFTSSFSVDTEPQPKSSYWADPNQQNYHSFKQAERRNPFTSLYSVDIEPQHKSSFLVDPNQKPKAEYWMPNGYLPVERAARRPNNREIQTVPIKVPAVPYLGISAKSAMPPKLINGPRYFLDEAPETMILYGNQQRLSPPPVFEPEEKSSFWANVEPESKLSDGNPESASGTGTIEAVNLGPLKISDEPNPMPEDGKPLKIRYVDMGSEIQQRAMSVPLGIEDDGQNTSDDEIMRLAPMDMVVHHFKSSYGDAYSPYTQTALRSQSFTTAEGFDVDTEQESAFQVRSALGLVESLDDNNIEEVLKPEPRLIRHSFMPIQARIIAPTVVVPTPPYIKYEIPVSY